MNKQSNTAPWSCLTGVESDLSAPCWTSPYACLLACLRAGKQAGGRLHARAAIFVLRLLDVICFTRLPMRLVSISPNHICSFAGCQICGKTFPLEGRQYCIQLSAVQSSACFDFQASPLLHVKLQHEFVRTSDGFNINFKGCQLADERAACLFERELRAARMAVRYACAVASLDCFNNQNRQHSWPKIGKERQAPLELGLTRPGPARPSNCRKLYLRPTRLRDWQRCRFR